MLTIQYPKDELLYWGNQSNPIQEVFCHYFEEIATSNDIEIIRDYIKHWIEFKGHQFEDESDRILLAAKADSCKTSSDIDNLVSILVRNFGIDPF